MPLNFQKFILLCMSIYVVIATISQKIPPILFSNSS